MEQEHYYAIETKDNELKHYGVKGMHWGIRRYQPYTSNPRKGGKTGKFIGNKSKVTKDDKGSMVGLGVGLAAAAIVGAKAAKAAAHRAQFKKVAKAAIKEAEAEKRKAEFEEYKKSVKNRKWTDHTDEEKKYAYTDAEKKSEMKLAKEKDQYNIDFLETIQNDYFLSDDHPDNKKIRQQEYKKYLDNPYRYMSTHDAVEDRPKSSDSKSGAVKDSKGSVYTDDLIRRLSGTDLAVHESAYDMSQRTNRHRNLPRMKDAKDRLHVYSRNNEPGKTTGYGGTRSGSSAEKLAYARDEYKRNRDDSDPETLSEAWKKYRLRRK